MLFVFVDFYADWCGPCKMLTPIIEEYSKNTSDVEVYKMNVDDNPQTPSEIGIRGIPTLALYKDGEIIDDKVYTTGVVEIDLDSLSEKDFLETDFIVEIGSEEARLRIFDQFKKFDSKIKIYSQKIDWNVSATVDDLPSTHKEGSIYISARRSPFE